MSEMHDLLLDGILNANSIVQDAESRRQRLAAQRGYLTRMAHMNGISIEEIANTVGVPDATIRRWMEPSGGDPEDC